jgi:hypothetical protein
VDRRVAYLLRIEEALHTYFPRNPEMRHMWVKRGNKQFGKRAPIAVMVEDGESGLIAVLSHLDCTFAWDLTGSKTEYSAADTGRALHPDRPAGRLGPRRAAPAGVSAQGFELAPGMGWATGAVLAWSRARGLERRALSLR